MITLKVTSEEYRLIETALEGDRLGTWGGDRGEKIQKLLKKLKRIEKEKVIA